MAVPLILGEEVIGFLLMDHPQPGMYTEETAALAGAVAAQAAVAVQNARLYEGGPAHCQPDAGPLRDRAALSPPRWKRTR
jgi:GAF domain-containing protein